MQIWLRRAVSFFFCCLWSVPTSVHNRWCWPADTVDLWRGLFDGGCAQKGDRFSCCVILERVLLPRTLSERSPEPKPVTPFCSCPTDDDDDRLLQLLALVGIFRSKLVKFLLMVEFMQILRLPDFSGQPQDQWSGRLKWLEFAGLCVGKWRGSVPPEHLICHSRELLRVGNSEKWR